jgi:hypothetical protein
MASGYFKQKRIRQQGQTDDKKEKPISLTSLVKAEEVKRFL